MATVWVPLKKPPDLRCVSGLSSDAQLVLAALKKFHQTKGIGSSCKHKAKWQIGEELSHLQNRQRPFTQEAVVYGLMDPSQTPCSSVGTATPRTCHANQFQHFHIPLSCHSTPNEAMQLSSRGTPSRADAFQDDTDTETIMGFRNLVKSGDDQNLNANNREVNTELRKVITSYNDRGLNTEFGDFLRADNGEEISGECQTNVDIVAMQTKSHRVQAWLNSVHHLPETNETEEVDDVCHIYRNSERPEHQGDHISNLQSMTEDPTDVNSRLSQEKDFPAVPSSQDVQLFSCTQTSTGSLALSLSPLYPEMDGNVGRDSLGTKPRSDSYVSGSGVCHSGKRIAVGCHDQVLINGQFASGIIEDGCDFLTEEQSHLYTDKSAIENDSHRITFKKKNVSACELSKYFNAKETHFAAKTVPKATETSILNSLSLKSSLNIAPTDSFLPEVGCNTSEQGPEQHPREDFKKPTPKCSKTSFAGCQANQRQKQTCGITKRLLEHRRKRKTKPLFNVPVKMLKKSNHLQQDPQPLEQRGACSDLPVFSASLLSETSVEILPPPDSISHQEARPTHKLINTSSKESPKMAAATRLMCVSSLECQQRAEMKQLLDTAEEVAMTLLYADQSSQLREPETTQKKRKNSDNCSMDEVTGVAVGIPGHSLKLEFVFFPFKNESITDWISACLCSLMESDTRKICFDAQELIKALVTEFKVPHLTVTAGRWLTLDPKVAGWLLDPDHPALTFHQLLKTSTNLNMSAPLGPESVIRCSDVVCDDLSLLGPAMLQLYHKLSSQGLWQLFLQLEMPLCPILAIMELRGLLINTNTMLQAGDVLKRKLSRLEEKAHEAAGHPFLINSHPQLRQVLFEELRLDQKLPQKSKVAKTAVGNLKSTSESVLTLLQDLHPLPALVLEYRQVQKLKSTYVDGLLVHVKHGYLHTHWEQASAATGRLTSTNPNIQAIPKQPTLVKGIQHNYIAGQEVEDKGTEVYARDPFISHDGFSLLAVDFQQIELRLLAHFSKDPSLLKIFQNSKSQDIFIQLTSQWLGKSICEVTGADREQTKRVVYSVMYGVGKERLADYLKMTQDEAKSIMNSFLVAFPGVNSFTKQCVEECRKKGYTTTIINRRRLFPHITHPAPHLRAQAERQAVNFSLQGSAADLCKAAMVQVEQALSKDLQAKLLVQIHDELLLEVLDEHLDKVKELVCDIMESADSLCGKMVKLCVPLRVSVSTGKTWGRLSTQQA